MLGKLKNIDFSDRNSLTSKVFDYVFNQSIEPQTFTNNGIQFYNENLNSSQKEAVLKSVYAKDLFSIHGPPGTGKTTTLIEILFQLVKRRKNILVATSSNAAVDHIAKQFMEMLPYINKSKLNILRVGNVLKINETLRPIVFKKIVQKEFEVMKRKNLELPSNIIHKISQNLVNKADIIFTTLSSSINEYVDKRLFDVLLIDEASQSLLAECVIPFSLCQKLIICGDHKQLPPVLKDLTNSKKYESLFDKLMKCSNHKDISVTLDIQYRMNERLIRFPSKTFYDNYLETDDSNRFITIRDYFPKIKDLYNFELFTSSIGFIDLSKYKFFSQGAVCSTSSVNTAEAAIVKLICDEMYFDLAKIPSLDDNSIMEKIGIITPYIAQRTLISKVFNESIEYSECLSSLEINTVDSFQGREKDIIIISLVRSSKDVSNRIGFLQDFRRLNVLLTRAKRLLILIGNFSYLRSGSPEFDSLCDYVFTQGHNMDYYINKRLPEIKTKMKEINKMQNVLKQNVSKNLLNSFKKKPNDS